MKCLIQLEDVGKHYGARTIFESVNAQFYANQKIGVIGRNGSGKSTLARLITGEEEPDSGRVVRTRDLRLSYLEQHDPYTPEETVLEFLMRYTDQEEWRCGEVAAKFKLEPAQLDTPIGRISGGFQTRVKLAAMLLRHPNFLVLDEPTNYLDLSTLLLLENFLGDFRGGYMIISHDREFLMRTCEQTLDVEGSELTIYPGDVEAYLAYKEEQVLLAEKGNRIIESKAKQLQVFIDRNRARAATATRAQSKIKQLERLNRGKISLAHAQRNVRIRIPLVGSRTGTALLCSDLEIGYPGRKVASDVHFEIQRGERIAILGNNGQGKTTLMRTLAGDLTPRGGSCDWAINLKLGYYAQHVYTGLTGAQDVLTYLQRRADRHVPHQTILDLAGSFLFQGHDVEKPISVLSGGERARLCLMGLLLAKSPVLLLDEPTNHLDFETVEALGEALKEFDGTLFFISHDRTFVNEIATGILEVKDGAVKRYLGTYEEYVDRLSGDLGVGVAASSR
ncbi:MAG: ABC-F family ATP-binding cassette domain-containing protein [Planctomycetes bacterium]|nr:ABC-F family ATP-binding cassette domain-containing protein [Planctomycetota bacterium]